MLNETFGRRFNELQAKFDKMPVQRSEYDRTALSYAPFDWEQWAASALSLLRAACGVDSAHAAAFERKALECRGSDYEVLGLRGIFLAAKEDFEGGYLFNVDLRVSGEVFGDFVVLAKEALASGHKDVAAVLACAALEDALKRYASINGLDTHNKGMQDIINGLKTAGLVAGAQKTLLDAMPRVRNAALHAQWEKLSEPDVSSVLGFVEQFLLTKFDA